MLHHHHRSLRALPLGHPHGRRVHLLNRIGESGSESEREAPFRFRLSRVGEPSVDRARALANRLKFFNEEPAFWRNMDHLMNRKKSDQGRKNELIVKIGLRLGAMKDIANTCPIESNHSMVFWAEVRYKRLWVARILDSTICKLTHLVITSIIKKWPKQNNVNGGGV